MKTIFNLEEGKTYNAYNNWGVGLRMVVPIGFRLGYTQVRQAQIELQQTERDAIDYARRNRLIDTGDASSGTDDGKSGGRETGNARSVTTTNLVQLNSSYIDARAARIAWVNYPSNPTAAGADAAFYEKMLEWTQRTWTGGSRGCIAASASGMPARRIIVTVMFISGFIGGLGGAGQALGVHYRFISGFSQGLGFDGIVVALLGRNNPIGALIAALFFGALRNGGSTMELFTRIPRDLIDILIALIIFFIAIDISFDWLRRRVRAPLPPATPAPGAERPQEA